VPNSHADLTDDWGRAAPGGAHPRRAAQSTRCACRRFRHTLRSPRSALTGARRPSRPRDTHTSYHHRRYRRAATASLLAGQLADLVLDGIGSGLGVGRALRVAQGRRAPWPARRGCPSPARRACRRPRRLRARPGRQASSPGGRLLYDHRERIRPAAAASARRRPAPAGATDRADTRFDPLLQSLCLLICYCACSHNRCAQSAGR